MFPIAISEQADLYDGGFLRIHFTNLHLGNPINSHREIEAFCRKFCEQHNRIIHYYVGLDDSWEISNYAYEDIAFVREHKSIDGKMYHVTGNDGTRLDGDNGSVFTIENKNILVLPLNLGRVLQGFFAKQKYQHGPNYGRNLFIGDAHTLVSMPQFRNRRRR